MRFWQLSMDRSFLFFTFWDGPSINHPLHPHKLTQPHTSLQLSNTISVSSRAVSYNSFASKGNNFSQAWANLKRTLALDAIAKGNWRSKWCRSCSLLFPCQMFVFSEKNGSQEIFGGSWKISEICVFVLGQWSNFLKSILEGNMSTGHLEWIVKNSYQTSSKEKLSQGIHQNLWNTFWSLPFSGPFLKRKRGHLTVTFWWEQLEVNEHPTLSLATKNNNIIWLLWLEGDLNICPGWGLMFCILK